VYVSLDHCLELLQGIVFPEVALALMRGVFGHGRTIAPVDGDSLGVTGDFGQVDVGSKRLEQTAPFLTGYILPADDDRFQHRLSFRQVETLILARLQP